MKVVYHIKRLSITLALLIVSLWAVLFFTSIPPLLAEVTYSRAIYGNHHHLLRLTLSHDDKYRLFTPLVEISPLLVTATLLQEDQYFYWHLGVNPISLIKAGWFTYGLGSRRVGASTITMQVARLRYGINSKTLTGKLLQIMRAIQLELHYSKEQILEAYLNLAPYGNNIEGVGAASLIYFDKPVHDLGLPEVLALVVIPQNPAKRLPSHAVFSQIRYQLYRRWLKQYPADANINSLMNLPMQMRSIHDVPFSAPHFVNQLLMDPSITQQQVVTTLDDRWQTIIERVMQSYIARKKSLGVNNAAVMLIDSRDMAIKAMLGSSKFFNRSIEGQINGTAIKRSPGSTLKPFIYGLAIDQGLIHPATVLKDVPQSFGGYNPENFDSEFVGPIKARDALVMSRNIPAIYLANQLNNSSLYQFLQQAGVSQLKAESYYGLALVLGGAELTMQELVTLYAALANEGVWYPLQMIKNNLIAPGKRLLSREASFLVLDMLKDTQPPEASSFRSLPYKEQLAWKTGTSSGYRDAWTIGVLGPYVLAVWLGNFNNQGNLALVGKEIAAPLFFEIITALMPQLSLSSLSSNPMDMNLRKVAVCKASGMLPTRYCMETEETWFVPGKSPIKTDTIYREVAIDSKTGLRACKYDHNTRFAIFEFWSSDLLKLFKQAGIQRRIAPPYQKECILKLNQPEAIQGVMPQISSPQSQVSYVFRGGGYQQAIIPLTAVVDGEVRNLYWFLNETFLGKVVRGRPFLWGAKPGKFVIRVVDDQGRSDVREVKVE